MTTSPDLAALRRAVDAAPADANARMAYADALDESGERVAAALQRVLAERDSDRHRLNYADALDAVSPAPPDARARLIRWQVATGVAFARDDSGRWRYDRKRAPEVPGDCWMGLNWHLGEPIPRPFTVRRGFVAEVVCPADRWLLCGDDVCAAHPVERVKLTTVPAVGSRGVENLGVNRTTRCAEYLVADRLVCISEKRIQSVGRQLVRPRGLEWWLFQQILAGRWPGVEFDLPAV